jgi:hypothetical protein
MTAMLNNPQKERTEVIRSKCRSTWSTLHNDISFGGNVLSTQNYDWRISGLAVSEYISEPFKDSVKIKIKVAQDQISVTVRQLQVLLNWGVLSDERKGLSFNCCWSSPAQLFPSPSAARITTIFYCLSFFSSYLTGNTLRLSYKDQALNAV